MKVLWFPSAGQLSTQQLTTLQRASTPEVLTSSSPSHRSSPPWRSWHGHARHIQRISKLLRWSVGHHSYLQWSSCFHLPWWSSHIERSPAVSSWLNYRRSNKRGPKSVWAKAAPEQLVLQLPVWKWPTSGSTLVLRSLEPLKNGESWLLLHFSICAHAEKNCYATWGSMPTCKALSGHDWNADWFSHSQMSVHSWLVAIVYL